mgnify:CR=1 FL=1
MNDMCRDCDDTGITKQTERACACQPPKASLPTAPTSLYIQWTDDGLRFEKWSHAPFEGGHMFAIVSDKAWQSYQYDPASYA